MAAVIAALAGIFVLLLVGKTSLAVVKAIGWDMLLFHFIRGADSSGKHKTNATWLHNATWEDNRRYAYVSEWNHLAKLPRVLWRLGMTLTIMAFGVMSLASHALFFAVAYTFAVFAGLSVLLSVIHRSSSRSHEKDILTPLISAIAQELNVPAARARQLLTLPKETLALETGVIGVVALPANYTPSDSKRTSFGKLLSDHVNRDVEVEWQVEKPPRQAIIRIAGRPPEKVLLSEYGHYMENGQPGNIFLGLDRFRNPYYRDLNAGEDPHWAFGARSGAGKSTFLGMTILQILANNPESLAVAIDPKGVSLAHLEGIPGFVYFSNHMDVTEMWEGIAGFKALMDERISLRKLNPALEFPEAVLLIDELPRFTDLTADAWREVSSRGYAPVWKDVRAVLQMGREFNCHVIAMAQRLDDKSTGISGTRSYFSFRGLAGFKENDWSMLIGTSPVEVSQPGCGRWVYVADDVRTWVQNIVPDGGSRTKENATMRAWADRHISPRELVFKPLEDPSRREPASNVSPSATIIGIANGANFLGMSHSAFRKAREERPINGEKKGKKGRVSWLESDLIAWQASRPRAGKALRGAVQPDTEPSILS
jgi:hypothetical protein